MKSPKIKSELVKLAYKLESTSSFYPSSISNIAVWGNQILVHDVRYDTKLRKCSRNENARPEFSVTKLYKDELIES